jgi:hypothetical protein
LTNIFNMPKSGEYSPDFHFKQVVLPMSFALISARPKQLSLLF